MPAPAQAQARLAAAVAARAREERRVQELRAEEALRAELQARCCFFPPRIPYPVREHIQTKEEKKINTHHFDRSGFELDIVRKIE